jgi:lysozyme
VLDAEDTTSGQTAAVAIQHIKDFLARVEARTGRRPMIYTAKYYFDAIGNPQDFASYPLWVANYNATCPVLPGGGWTGWQFWQYSSTGSVGGISGSVDLDHFNGSLADLMAFANPPPPDAGVDPSPDASQQPPPPPPGDDSGGGCSAIPGGRR